MQQSLDLSSQAENRFGEIEALWTYSGVMPHDISFCGAETTEEGWLSRWN